MIEMSTDWQKVIDFYENRFGIPAKVVNYLAVYDFLQSCCVGLSNGTIATQFEVETAYVKQVLIEFLNFNGWSKDLDISPLFVYNKVNGVKELYWSAVMAIPGVMGKSYVNKSYSICKKFLKIEKEIDKYYG